MVRKNPPDARPRPGPGFVSGLVEPAAAMTPWGGLPSHRTAGLGLVG
jgi:hypothetical protein